MSVLAWVVLGLVSGFIASKLVTGSGKGLLVDLVLGVVGALVGGAAFHLLGQVGVTGFNLWSILVSVVGAVVVLGLLFPVRRSVILPVTAAMATTA